MARYKAYIICTSPRSGSTLLCKLLAATGVSGNPDSLFHSPSVFEWMRYYKLSADQFATELDALRAIFHAAHRQGTGNTKIFGLRLQRHSFDFFMQQIAVLSPKRSSDLERIQAAFGDTLFIHLTRHNKLEQAISFVKATQTGLWHVAPDGSELERVSAPQEPVYDAREIAARVAEFKAYDKDWNAWFAKEKLVPLRLSYDELSADSAGSLARILDKLGLDWKTGQHISLPTAKLADGTSRIWAKRFLSERRDF